jgi:hypothetical protein
LPAADFHLFDLWHRPHEYKVIANGAGRDDRLEIFNQSVARYVSYIAIGQTAATQIVTNDRVTSRESVGQLGVPSPIGRER